MRELAAILTLGFASPASATSEWFMLTPAVSGNHAVQMADATSLREVDGEVRVWTHLFLKEPQGELKSYLLQYGVNCEARETRELRYIDFDVSYRTLESGDNSETDAGRYRSIAPGTIGDLIVNFACSDNDFRVANFLKIAEDVNYRTVADFFLQDGEIVQTK